MPISSDFTSIYTKDWEVNFIQCYPNGRLKHTELCNILQLTAGSHAETGGLSYSDMQLNDQAWVLSRMRVEITELPKWRDIVTVKTWIVDMQGSRSVRALELFIGTKKIASSLTYWVVLNTKLRKPETLALPANHFEIFQKNVPTQKSFEKINLNLETQFVKDKTVLLSDLDIVNHANNVKYLEWCMDCIEPNVIFKNEIQAFDMNFIKELHWQDEVELQATLESIPKHFFISKNGIKCFALAFEYS